MPNPIAVYLVDSHELLRRGIASCLDETADLAIVGQAGTYAQGVAEIVELRPHVVIVDADLPDGDGIDLCRRVRADNPDLHCLILTAEGVGDAVSAAFNAGATGYALNRIESSTLVSTVRLVSTGNSVIDSTVAALVQQMIPDQKCIDAVSGLTPQQRRILFLIAEGLTNRQIGDQLFLAEKTIKNHVTALLAHLKLERRGQAALLAARIRTATGDPALSHAGATRTAAVDERKKGPE